VPSSIIRGLAVVTEPADRRHWQQINDGAVLQRDGVIAEIGPLPSSPHGMPTSR
jgi:hypothetical protein